MSVDPNLPQVNARRAYNASSRREQARVTHEGLLDAALARFLEAGYAGTTVETIALHAGVSVATIYKTYGGKPGVVRALCTRALEGHGPIPAERRSDALHHQAADPRTIIGEWGRLTAEVSPRIAPILLLLRDAATVDEIAAELYAELDARRLARMTRNARALTKAGHVRADLRLRDVRDVLWLYSSAEIYELLVQRRRWSIRRYSEFVAASIIAAVL